MEELLRLFQEREIQKLHNRLEMSKRTKLYVIEYEFPPLTEIRTVRIFTDSEDDAILSVLNGGQDRVIRSVTVCEH